MVELDAVRVLRDGDDALARTRLDGAWPVDLVLSLLQDAAGSGDRAARDTDDDGTGPDDRTVQILLIEDNRDVADLMRMLLEGWGCAVRVARSGETALQEAVRGPSVDVVFCDLNLPDVSGIALLPRLRATESCRRSLCVSLSGVGGREWERSSREAGFARHVVKPARFEELREIVDSVRA